MTTNLRSAVIARRHAVDLTTVWPVICLGLIALPLCAQPYGEHDEAPLSVGLWPNSVPVVRSQSARQAPAGKISAELLRYPLSGKARRMLQKALATADSGDHAAAAQQLQQTLDKCPDSGAYVYSLLGVEYLKTDHIPEAVDALEQAVKLLPHDASNHANLGLSLVSAGQYDRAEPELRRALELDPRNSVASQLLNALALSKTQK
jgi:tetratricopeptide (TPR) repeat protein